MEAQRSSRGDGDRKARGLVTLRTREKGLLTKGGEGTMRVQQVVVQEVETGFGDTGHWWL